MLDMKRRKFIALIAGAAAPCSIAATSCRPIMIAASLFRKPH
jgi:hypothetical protein